MPSLTYCAPVYGTQFTVCPMVLCRPENILVKNYSK